jgi:uncharacterized membrane protein YgaE (UPF0421/DUF939 family)
MSCNVKIPGFEDKSKKINNDIESIQLKINELVLDLKAEQLKKEKEKEELFNKLEKFVNLYCNENHEFSSTSYNVYRLKEIMKTLVLVTNNFNERLKKIEKKL